MTVAFLPSGDTGLTVQFGYDIDRALSQRIMALRSAVDEIQLHGVLETVPTYRSLLVHYDPLLTTQSDLIAQLRPLLARLDTASERQAKHWSLPVCFDEAFAPDLAHVAEFAKMDSTEVIGHLTSTDHFVYMLGFAPGLPYMGDLPEQLAIPRRETPIMRVPKGSVLVATGLTIIYPAENPTGWHIVGRCPVPIFDLGKEDPVLLSPGDHVRYQQVGRTQFQDIESQVAEGRYVIQEETVL